MIERSVTPTYNGFPLPIAPDISGPHLTPLQESEHHSWHPKNAPEFARASVNSSLIQRGIANLRYCGLFKTQNRLHNYGPNAYHEYYSGPPIPTSIDDVARINLLSLAGFVPPQGIDLTSGTPEIIKLTTEHVKRLHGEPIENQKFGTKKMRTFREPVREFLESLIIRAIPVGLDEDTLETFIGRSEGSNPKLKNELGHLVLKRQIEVVVRVAEEDYALAALEGRLDPRVIGMTLSEFIKDMVLGKPENQEGRLFPALESALRAHYRAA